MRRGSPGRQVRLKNENFARLNKSAVIGKCPSGLCGRFGFNPETRHVETSKRTVLAGASPASETFLWAPRYVRAELTGKPGTEVLKSLDPAGSRARATSAVMQISLRRRRPVPLRSIVSDRNWKMRIGGRNDRISSVRGASGIRESLLTHPKPAAALERFEGQIEASEHRYNVKPLPCANRGTSHM